MKASERNREERKARANLQITLLRILDFILSDQKH